MTAAEVRAVAKAAARLVSAHINRAPNHEYATERERAAFELLAEEVNAANRPERVREAV